MKAVKKPSEVSAVRFGHFVKIRITILFLWIAADCPFLRRKTNVHSERDVADWKIFIQ